MRRLAGWSALAAASILLMGQADKPSDRLPDPVQEARARALFEGFRCVVCQNESIAESEAPIALDLRRIVRGQIVDGRTDAQVRAFMVQRYGEFILMQPPFNPGNAALWLAPIVVAAAGGLYIWRRTRRRAPADAEASLSPDEEAALARLQSGADADVIS